MARPESVAVGGYFPTPKHLLPRIAALFEPKAPDLSQWQTNDASYMDPCAGDGEAIFTLAKILNGDSNRVDVFACELEQTRFEGAQQKQREMNIYTGNNFLHGDAFRVTFNRESKVGVSVLFLNPPYDTDPVHGRLEQRYLARFTPAIMPEGALLFVVPFYALKASAEFIAREFDLVKCFRFPAEDFAAFKQIVLYARRGPSLFDPDPKILEKVRTWAEDVSKVPELPQVGAKPVAKVATAKSYQGGVADWSMRPVDVTTILKKCKPWMQTTRGGTLVPVHGIIPELPVQDMLLRCYPVATPPRPAHIAAGIASGLFNGARLEPSGRRTKLPPLLVKGVFDREYKTVEERHAKDGSVKAIVQVQQPKLVTTVLDLSTHKYHTLRTGIEESKAKDVASMGVADLIKHYGDSMMQVMERQCPILYDPRRDADSITVAESPRQLFTAQSHAVRALVKLLGGPKATARKRKHKAGILLGEIGSGKSTVATMTARTIGARRMLVLCPPHLLKSWTNEIAAISPDAKVKVLTSVEDLDQLSEDKSDFVVSILSRETAKLTHGWEGCGPVCPKCGMPTPQIDLAKKRARCEHKALILKDDFSRTAFRLATHLAPYAPTDPSIGGLLRNRFQTKMLESLAKKAADKDVPKFSPLPIGDLDEILEKVVALYKEGYGDRDRYVRAIVMILHAAGDDERILRTALQVRQEHYSYGTNLEKDLILMLKPGDPRQAAYVQEAKKTATSAYYNPWTPFAHDLEQIQSGGQQMKIGPYSASWASGKLVLGDDTPRYSLKAALAALVCIGRIGSVSWGPECGEYLFDAIPEPRRVALARHIVKYHPDLFDFLVLDEGHEYATDGSAQERSAHRLTSLGIPTVLMTGSIMNGYAESLFTNMWALSPEFRLEFERDERQKFIDRYGYRKRVVEDKDKETGEVVEFGSMSDRVTRSERVIGNAPGVLPLFLLRHLLPFAVTLHKTDLAIDLPPCSQFTHAIEADDELRSRFRKLQDALVAQIRKDQFQPDLAGRLWGQLAELPSYLDRATCDVGNVEGGDYEIRYPESVGSQLVAVQPGLPLDTILPKEEWMLSLVEKELAEGRNVMVFCWHVALLPRLARLISQHTNVAVPILYADKVSTGKRQDWIDREVVRPNRRVLVTNPVAIQTGLNNLVHFASEIWMENPACNPIIFRQAIGRVDRIGQTLPSKIHFPVYKDTLQQQLYDLLMKKVAVSISTDGLDPESALQAAGVSEDEYLAGMSIGKQLWKMLTDGAD
jgi:hypothetical protein